MATGLYVTPDGKVMVAYGSRLIPIAGAQYKANGYRPSLEKLTVQPEGSEGPRHGGPRHKDMGAGSRRSGGLSRQSTRAELPIEDMMNTGEMP